MDEIPDRNNERLEEMHTAAISVCEGAKTLTELLLEKYREEHDLLKTVEHVLSERKIEHKHLPHLDDLLNIRIGLADLLDEVDLLRRGILPSRN